MAKRRAPKAVETLTHAEASRKNIPTAEYQAVMEDDDRSPVQVAYERRNRDLDPQLVWRGKVRQRTLLNLGRHFGIGREGWPRLCARNGDILDGQAGLLGDVPADVEAEAQRIAALLLARGLGEAPGEAGGAVEVHPDSMALARPRSVGVEQVGLWAMEQVGLMPLLEALGVNGALRAAAAGLIVGRLAHPASERETHRWLDRSASPSDHMALPTIRR